MGRETGRRQHLQERGKVNGEVNVHKESYPEIRGLGLQRRRVLRVLRNWPGCIYIPSPNRGEPLGSKVGSLNASFRAVTRSGDRIIRITLLRKEVYAIREKGTWRGWPGVNWVKKGRQNFPYCAGLGEWFIYPTCECSGGWEKKGSGGRGSQRETAGGFCG